MNSFELIPNFIKRVHEKNFKSKKILENLLNCTYVNKSLSEISPDGHKQHIYLLIRMLDV